MSAIIEIRWTPELRAEIARWILNEAQLPAIEAADMATPQMVELTSFRRLQSARRKVQSLQTLLETGRLPVIDLDMIEAVDRLRLANATEVKA